MKTIREEKVGKTTLRLVQVDKGYAGVVLLDGKSRTRIDGGDPEEVWQKLRAQAASSSPNYFGYSGAKNRFLSFFPNGFSSCEYVKEEREYKIGAKELLDSTVPLEEALEKTGYGEAIKSVFNKTNLLSQFEKMRLNDTLSGDGADAFVKGAAKMAIGDVKAGLRDMEKALKPYDAAKWTVVTYLPYLWNPVEHMFLKPEVTKDFAERVGHPFFTDYETKLDADVYESLLDLTRTTEKEIVDLRPKDGIDVQSFIWVVGAYDENSMDSDKE